MTDEEVLAKRKIIRDRLSDLMEKFLYYDRKDDDELRPGVIEGMIGAGLLTVEELSDWTAEALRKGLGR